MKKKTKMNNLKSKEGMKKIEEDIDKILNDFLRECADDIWCGDGDLEPKYKYRNKIIEIINNK